MLIRQALLTGTHGQVKAFCLTLLTGTHGQVKAFCLTLLRGTHGQVNAFRLATSHSQPLFPSSGTLLLHVRDSLAETIFLSKVKTYIPSGLFVALIMVHLSPGMRASTYELCKGNYEVPALLYYIVLYYIV